MDKHVAGPCKTDGNASPALARNTYEEPVDNAEMEQMKKKTAKIWESHSMVVRKKCSGLSLGEADPAPPGLVKQNSGVSIGEGSKVSSAQCRAKRADGRPAANEFQGVSYKPTDDDVFKFTAGNKAAQESKTQEDDSFRFVAPTVDTCRRVAVDKYANLKTANKARSQRKEHAAAAGDEERDGMYVINQGQGSYSGVFEVESEMPWQATMKVKQMRAGKTGLENCNCEKFLE